MDGKKDTYRLGGHHMYELKYLRLLSERYTTQEEVANRIIDLSAVKSLPKGTEYFFSDLHGEYEAFLHLLKSASGMIRTKIDAAFGKTLTSDMRSELANLIYYPEETMHKKQKDGDIDDEWRRITIYQLIHVSEVVSAKYTRARVRNRIATEYRYILDELLNVSDDINKDFYFNEIINSIIETGIADAFICELSKLIQRISIDQVHIIGDVFDRGPRADIIMKELIKFGEVDFQWGNHDISWMGASLGNKTLIAVVLRISMAYNNFDLLEDGYGINLRPLYEFADSVYTDDMCGCFTPHMLDDNVYDTIAVNKVSKMHKAITIIQLKLEGQMIKKHPEYEMDHRNLLEKVNYDNMTVEIEGKTFELLDKEFPTIDPRDPLKLTEEEEELMEMLAASFKHSSSLQKNIHFMYKNGSCYKKVNDNLLYHGCLPLNEDGTFQVVNIDGKDYSGKALMDYVNLKVEQAFYSLDKEEKLNAQDYMWYLWCGQKSPLFGKSKMANFEQYFIGDPALKKETLNPYFTLSEQEDVCDMIMDEFGINKEKGHIINGHVPVKLKDGESPIKANGKLFIIDGGISKAYQTATGIAGYTLIYDSHALRLAQHKPFKRWEDNTPTVQIVEKMPRRVNIADTDKGKKIEEEICDLKSLLEAYRKGLID